MRRTALSCIHELATRDERVVFIGSDITKRDVEAFAEEFPNRFFMEGIYEQHLVGMAAGLALSGKIPFVNTIATFLTRRCFEQILVDLCIHNLPVRLIGSGGGVVYAPLGSTHIAIEDIAILRAIPNMTIISPSDAEEMKRLMPHTLDWPNPIYIRLAKGGDPILTSRKNTFEIGKAVTVTDGAQIVFISTGTTSYIAKQAAGILANDGTDVGVLHMHTIKPLDKATILKTILEAKVVLTIEEHRITGGLGSAVSELIAEEHRGKAIKFKRIGFPDTFTEELGSQTEIMDKYGITVENILKITKELLH
jgi:transketolase